MHAAPHGKFPGWADVCPPGQVRLEVEAAEAAPLIILQLVSWWGVCMLARLQQ
jgi:hypothetical protein